MTHLSHGGTSALNSISQLVFVLVNLATSQLEYKKMLTEFYYFVRKERLSFSLIYLISDNVKDDAT